MKKLLCLLFLSAILLSGCESTLHIENCAYAVSLGVDYSEDEFEISVQVPSIGGEGGSKPNEPSSSYQIYAAKGNDFIRALNTLQALLPQKLDLSLLKSIVFSEEFAKSDVFHETVKSMIHIFSLSANANVIITRSSAKTLLENQKSYIGIRLSVTVPALLETHTQSGYIVSTSLSILFAGLESFYSTPLTAYADSRSDKEPSKGNDAFLPGEMPYEGENKTEYMGCAVFGRERMVGILTGHETQLIHFLTGTGNRVADLSSPTSVRITERRAPKITIDVSGEIPVIAITLFLNASPLMNFPDMNALADDLKLEFSSLISKCQALGVEPFQFAERAARHFRTTDEWQNYDWLNAFSKAEIRLKIDILGEK